MNNFFDRNDYFFNNIYPYLSKKEQKECLKILKKSLKNINQFDDIDELQKILCNDDIVESIKKNKKKLITIIPEINDMIGFDHKHPHHHLDVWEHTLLALSMSENDFEIRLCLLLHDIGKPHCYQDLEIRHFKGHSKISSDMSKKILKRLNYDIEFIEKICYLIEKHDTPITKDEIINNSDLEYKRYKIQYCDALAHNPCKLDKRLEYLKDTLSKFEKNKQK